MLRTLNPTQLSTDVYGRHITVSLKLKEREKTVKQEQPSEAPSLAVSKKRFLSISQLTK
jgi:hypothetical protein